MKNDFLNRIDACWRVLTDVPGWPDAPRRLRIRRLLPIVIPIAAMALLVLWNFAWMRPRIRAERAAHQSLISLQQEVADLQLAGSEAQAAEVAARAADASRMLLNEPKELAPILEPLTKAARNHGWSASYTAIPGPPVPPRPDALLGFVTARGKLSPAPDNGQAFSALIVMLEQFSPKDRSIDLTRLTVRADEQGRHSAEVHLRAACRLSP